MPFKPREIGNMLEKKLGMTSSNADHIWYELQFSNLPPIRTKLPNHKDDIGPELESKICNQLRVRKVFFHGLMECTKYRADYEKQIQEDPFPPFSVLLV